MLFVFYYFSYWVGISISWLRTTNGADYATQCWLLDAYSYTQLTSAGDQLTNSFSCWIRKPRLNFWYHKTIAPTCLEPQCDFLVCALNGVRSVNDITADLNAQITADGARCWVCWVGSAQHDAASLHDVQAFPDHRNDWTWSHVRDESWEEWTSAQVGVVLLQQLLRGLETVAIYLIPKVNLRLTNSPTWTSSQPAWIPWLRSA